MATSKRRSYLKLKQSLVQFFTEPIRLLKEGTGKESIYEKPYLDTDYKAMHIAPSVPDWPTSFGSFGPVSSNKGGFEKVSNLKHTFVFRPPKCDLFPTECIEHDDTGLVHGFVIPSLAPVEAGAKYTWELIADTEAIDIKEIQSIQGGAFVQYRIIPIDDDFEGTVTICAKATLNGEIVRKLVFEKEAGDIVRQKLGPETGAGFLILGDPIKKAPAKELSRDYFKENIFDCGCISFDVPCEPTECEEEKVATYVWDYVISARFLNRNDNVVIAVKDGNKPYLWTVEGQGFWFDLGYTMKSIETETVSVTLYADNTACGSGNVTVMECYDRKVFASILCPDDGQWVVCKFPVECDTEGGDVSGCVFHPNTNEIFQLGGLRVDLLGTQGGFQPYYCCQESLEKSCSCTLIPTTSDCMNIDFYGCGRSWQLYIAGDDGDGAYCPGSTAEQPSAISNFHALPSQGTSRFSFRYWDCT